MYLVSSSLFSYNHLSYYGRSISIPLFLCLICKLNISILMKTKTSRIIRNRWQRALRDRKYLIKFTCSLIILLATAFFIPFYFEFVQVRKGIRLNDLLLDMIPPADCSFIIFTLLYSTLIAGVISVLHFPARTVSFIVSYILLSVFRIMSVYFFPLEPPGALVTLNDPVVDLLFYNKNTITKDLFFSGHSATLFLIFHYQNNNAIRKYLLLVAVVVSFLLLIQHVHYTIDVLAAPFFAFLTFSIIRYVENNNT